jgi:CRISPR-associated exonuclease Cas4
MLHIAIILFILAIFLLSQSTRQRKAVGLPGGRAIYSDTRTWGVVEKPLYDHSLDLVGKPDYIIQREHEFVPVEVKSSRISQSPYDSHIFQLASYCRLVEAEYNKRPTHGILHYPNQTFRIDYTPELEVALLELLVDMRSKKYQKEIHRSHNAPQRCGRCGFRSFCDQRIDEIE